MLLWQLILIQAITFVVIIIFLRLLFYRHLSTALRRLQELYRQNLEKEVALNKELERAKQERLTEIEKGKEEAKKLRDAARTEAERIKAQMLTEAKQETERMIQEANQECSRLKQETINQIQESSVNLACTMIREIFSEKARQELQKELVDELIEELSKIEKQKLKVQTQKAQVISSYPLLDIQKNAIKAILQDALESPLELEEKTDAAIISGLVINLGGLILDGSLQNKLRKIIPYLRVAGSG